MRFLRPLTTVAFFSIVLGTAGGLAFGYVLSRRGEWLVATPWLVYLAVVLVLVGAITLIDALRHPGAAVANPSGQAATMAIAQFPGPAPTNVDEQGSGRREPIPFAEAERTRQSGSRGADAAEGGGAGHGPASGEVGN